MRGGDERREERREEKEEGEGGRRRREEKEGMAAATVSYGSHIQTEALLFLSHTLTHSGHLGVSYQLVPTYL